MLLTTHYMFEADTLCDRIAVVAKGTGRRRGHASRPEGAASSDGTSSRSRCTASTGRRVEGLRAIDGVTSVAVEDRDQAQVVVVQAAAGPSRRTRSSPGCEGVSVGRVTTREPTLEDAYVALVTEQPVAGDG